MSKEPYAQLTKGTFIIASPDINSGMYFRGVILICEHGPTGSFGILVNKVLDVEIPEEVINMKEITNPRLQIRAGGPLQPNQMMLVHSNDQQPDITLKLCDGTFLGGDMQFLQEAMSDPNGPAVLLCFGYCGWGPGQLEREFLAGMWFICPASSKHVFDTSPEKLWQTILREMGGKYATLSMIPDDLSLN
jgi:putative transcriptional regulator